MKINDLVFLDKFVIIVAIIIILNIIFAALEANIQAFAGWSACLIYYVRQIQR